MDKAQQQLAEAMIATNKEIVVIYIGGRPRVISNIVENENVKAVLIGFLPGNRGAEAIADILFDEYNPSGKLPLTYPRNVNGQTPYDIRPLENFAPNKYEYLYPFGFGLSYTTFIYSDLTVLNNFFITNPSDTLQITVNVLNNGTRPGKHESLL